MTRQRNRAKKVKIWSQVFMPDNRGMGSYHTPTDDNGVPTGTPIEVKATFSVERTSQASLAGQQEVALYFMNVGIDVDVSTWGMVEWRGRYWDIDNVPEYREGSRKVAHQRVEIRLRPLMNREISEPQYQPPAGWRDG